MLLAVLAFLFLLFAFSYKYHVLKKQMLMKLIKQQFFKQNGGLLLQQQLAALSRIYPSDSFRIFTTEELDIATANYSESRIIGHSSSSTVYKALFPNASTLLVFAVKKWCHLHQSHVEQFINELLILSTLPHNNIVRILGCCLETPVPLVVYEYVPNGTLHHHIHALHGSLSWEARLRIAAGTAEALRCLQSAIPGPLFHRGVKSADILLDDELTPKVEGFGARLVILDCEALSRMLKGRGGYLEPEFFRSFEATEKGDVYSFGVVMAELLTGELPVLADGDKLGVRFAAEVREGRLFEMLEGRVREEGRWEVVKGVGEVARRCLMVKGDERPTMWEVAEELRRLIGEEEKAGEYGGSSVLVL